MSELRQPVIVGAARTPVGRLLGSLASKSASELGGVAIAAALDRAGVAPDQVQYVIMGQVLQAGAGQITARQAAVAAGIPMTIPALTVNKVCLSGLDAIALASQLVWLGEYDVVVAGGMESMTQAPHLLVNSRAGYRYGPVTVEDSMALDGLTDAFDHLSMGESTERSGRQLGITRQEQDEFAVLSHQRAAEAAKNGLFTAEIAAVPVRHKSEQLTVTEDEGIRPGTTIETLARLRPAFGADGTITAGTSSQISDGAAAVVVMSAEAAERAGLSVLATIGAHGNVAGPDNSLHSQPSRAIKQALAKAGLSLASVSAVVPGRMPSSSVTVSCSPLLEVGTPAISAANRPFLAAAAARWWDMAANSSCCSRVMPSSRPLRSVDSPMDRWSKASVSPSSAIESSTVTGPYL
jgi:acetyl-CoA C-acetyltransferase